MYCINCGAQIDQAAFCSTCGTKQQAGRSRLAGGSAHREPANGIDLRRLSVTDMVTAIASLVVLVSLFLPWYSIPQYGGPSFDALGSVSGGFRFLVLVLSLLVMGYLGAKTVWPTQPRLPLPEWQLLTLGTGFNLLVVVITFLVAPMGMSTGGAGAALGMIAAVAAAVAVGHSRVAVAHGAPAAPGARRSVSSPLPRVVPRSTVQHPGPNQAGQSDVVGPRPSPSASGAPSAGAGRRISCTSCGAALITGNRFCVGCGAAVS